MGSVMAQSSPAPEEPLQAKERGQEVPVQHVHSAGTHRHTLCPHPTGKVARTNCANHSDSAPLFPEINRIPQLSNPQRQKPVNNSGSASSLLLTQLSPGTLALKQRLLLSKHVPLPPTSCPGGSRILCRVTFALAPGAELQADSPSQLGPALHVWPSLPPAACQHWPVDAGGALPVLSAQSSL